MVNYPIVFCLLYLFKCSYNEDHRPKISPVVYGFLIVAVVTVTCIAFLVGGFETRYIIDFAIFFIFPSLFCAYYWIMCGFGGVKNRLGVVYILLAATIFVGLFAFVYGTFVSYRDPTLYRYLEYSLGLLL